DLVEVATRHPSGCELLCLPAEGLGRHQLRLLRHALDRHYDLLVLDCAADAQAREGPEDVADVLFGVGLPSMRSADGAFSLAEDVLVHRRRASTVLLVNQLRAASRLSDASHLGFEAACFLPYESAIAETDRRGVPWGLRPDAAAAALRKVAGQL